MAVNFKYLRTAEAMAEMHQQKENRSNGEDGDQQVSATNQLIAFSDCGAREESKIDPSDRLVVEPTQH